MGRWNPFARLGAAIREVGRGEWSMPALAEDEVVIADLAGRPGTHVRLTDRRLLHGGLQAFVVLSETAKPPLSIPYEEIVDIRYLSNLAAYDEPWGMCLVLRSGETVWLHLWKKQAEHAIRIIENRRAAITGARTPSADVD